MNGRGILVLVAVLAGMFPCFGAAGASPAAKVKEKVFFFVAHPDDTIACAGTMFLMKDMFEYFVDISEVADMKREFIRKHVCQNRNDSMCQLEMADGEMCAQRCAMYMLGSRQVERFAQYDGKPQGSRCIFNELPPPKGWSQDWSAAKPSKWTPEGGMK